MIILILNCGSSSIKYQVVSKTSTEYSVLAKGLMERVGLPNGNGIITHSPAGKPSYESTEPIPNHTVGINTLLRLLTDSTYGVIKSLDEIEAVGHRVVHGGEYFADSSLVDSETVNQIKDCISLAPLHNPANVKGIMAAQEIMPNIPQVVTFDTSFHQTMPAKNYMYAIPYRYYEELKVRKYGFHGASHQFISNKACEMTGIDLHNSKIISCHIGNGASITAILNGESQENSQGFTPNEGLIMGTRCGDIDPGALVAIAKKDNLSPEQINDLVNKESGVAGFSEISSDMRDIETEAKKGNERAILTLEMYDGRLRKYIGAYAAKMGGVDLVVFTGGVGENGPERRESVCRELGFMGIDFDAEANKGVRGKDKILSKTSSRVKVVVATTDEEFVIASDTYRLVTGR